MKKLMAIVVGCVLAGIPTAFAMPSFPEVNHPWLIGYHISATADGAGIHFTLNLNKTASAALSKKPSEIHAEDSAGWSAENPELLKIKVRILQTPDGRKRMEFTLPKNLLPGSWLRVYSEPLAGDDFIRQVWGYSFQLDRVRVGK